ncbi:MAG: PilZ domain-containing protein [Myxococcales bacterium]|nr:PilZ domain-containing protein [Myxococcales bacterium]
MEIRNLYDAVQKRRELERKKSSPGLNENEGLQLTELSSYVEFMLSQRRNVQNRVRVKKIPTPIGSEYEIDVAFSDLSDLYEGFVISKARGGIYLKTDDLLLVGTQAWVTIRIESEHLRFRFNAKVVWSTAKAMGTIPPGLGLKFSDLKARDREIIEAFVDGRGDPQSLRQISTLVPH